MAISKSWSRSSSVSSVECGKTESRREKLKDEPGYQLKPLELDPKARGYGMDAQHLILEATAFHE